MSAQVGPGAPDLGAAIAGLLPALDVRLRRATIARIAERIAPEIGPEPMATPVPIGALARAIDAAVAELDEVDRAATALSVAVQSAPDERARREVLVAHLRGRSRDPVRLRGDIRATRRWLDLEALLERLAAEGADLIDQVELAYRAIAEMGRRVEDVRVLSRILSDAGILPAAIGHAARSRSEPIRVAALQTAASLLARLPVAERLGHLGGEQARRVVGWARGESTSRWARVAAFEVCATVFPDEAPELLAAELGRRDRPDGMVVRRNALRLLGEAARVASDPSMVLAARDDPSEHVRQELCRVLGRIPGERAIEALATLARDDASPRVKGIALRELTGRALLDSTAIDAATAEIERALQRPDEGPVARVALESIERLAGGPHPAVGPDTFVPYLSRIVEPPEIAEAAGALLLRLAVEDQPLAEVGRRALAAVLGELSEGESRRVRLPEGLDGRDLERALAVAARGDLAVSLRVLAGGRAVLTRGEPRSLRLWRLLHELRNPMPDKRKGIVHTVARKAAGEIVVPPLGMAEVTPTRVPGERRVHQSVGGWGPFLPRVDDLEASLERGGPVRIVTSMGTVVVEPPRGRLARLAARAILTLRYAELARERERSLDADRDDERRRFARWAARLGFSISIADPDGQVGRARFVLPSVIAARFLSLAPVVLPGWLDDALAHLLSPSSSEPSHLAAIAWLVLCGLVFRAAWILRSIERARGAIPLTIGGWGTRGKSGSERLKAALFHGLRYDVVVKTTGCEAMFIHARRDLPAREVFLYRPYDKATIWEQRDVLESARRLGAQVFLWECMALQPRFVDLLARMWMRDEITTLTNAYPDHEDVMGPSGEDVARVIARFLPRRGLAFTTEEQMLPLIRDAARKSGTRLQAVGPIEAELLPQDLLARLPYDEHPRNVALVLALAEHFGIDRERAFVEIADHVVPDLGVLKTYPTVSHRGRTLSFSNGMSANERAGFLSNWVRLGFDRHDPQAEPGRLTVLVVNNRADRVPRSRVFAQILVDDVAVDRIVAIGSNLGGLMTFLEQALDARLGLTSLAGQLERFDAEMRRLEIPTRPEEALRRILAVVAPEVQGSPEVADAVANLDVDALAAVLGEADDVPGDVVLHARALVKRTALLRDARAEVERALARGEAGQADEIFRRAYRELFFDRVSVLEPKDATGDQVIDFVARQVPPGHHGSVMGCQNIKGTGLDFVYRWLSIAAVRSALERLDGSPRTRAETLSWLGTHGDFGLVDCREALDRLRRIQAEGGPDWAEHAALLGSVVTRLERLEVEKAAALSATSRRGLAVKALGVMEGLLDHLDSIRRRRLANRIMADLFAQRIGQDRAALLFRDLVKREKGGWLAQDLSRWLSYSRSAGGRHLGA